jgi:hypothetical protein
MANAHQMLADRRSSEEGVKPSYAFDLCCWNLRTIGKKP